MRTKEKIKIAINKPFLAERESSYMKSRSQIGKNPISGDKKEEVFSKVIA